MNECAKACKRRSTISAFTQHYMAGKAIDIGAGSDGLSRHRHLFPKITSVREWDMADGDAQEMRGVQPNTYDLVHSSHSLEHMRHPWTALHRWWEILKPQGHLVVVIPEYFRYEQKEARCFPPSDFNSDHKSGFTMRFSKRDRNVRYVPELLAPLPFSEIQRIELLDHTMPSDWQSRRTDHSQQPTCEPAIEFVVRKCA